MPRRPRPHVALMVETSTIFGRRILEGIARYLRAHREWSVFLEQRALDTVAPHWLEAWRGDGIISRVSSPDFEAAILRARVPAVDLTHRRAPFGVPRIVSDDHAIGCLAAEHLLGRGFRSLAFCGYTGLLWSARRRDSFLAQAPGPARVHESPWGGPDAGPWEQDQKAIARWLKDLPRPVGVLACNDVRGLNVVDACHRAGLDVPRDVAVLGVDDDPLLCELCDPPLSSVVPNPERIGYEAAALLDRLMDGPSPSGGVPPELWIPPLGVATRLSTDALMIDDPRVAAAVRFIRENACRGITVRDVLEHVPLSRTALERRFRRDLGRSPQAEIRGVQLRRAKELLIQTDLKMDRIAELTGFEHPEYFSVVFKREVGRTPGRFRRESRSAASRPDPAR